MAYNTKQVGDLWPRYCFYLFALSKDFSYYDNVIQAINHFEKIPWIEVKMEFSMTIILC